MEATHSTYSEGLNSFCVFERAKNLNFERVLRCCLEMRVSSSTLQSRMCTIVKIVNESFEVSKAVHWMFLAEDDLFTLVKTLIKHVQSHSKAEIICKWSKGNL